MNDGPGSSHLDLDAPYLKVRVDTSINKRQIASVNFIPSRTWHSRTCTYGWTEPKSKTGFTISVGKTEISVIFPVSATHREANFGSESG